MVPQMQTVNVLYKYVDGAHFFISNDKEALGLCVAHKDLAKAMEAVAVTLTTLFKENHGIDIVAFPKMFARNFHERTRSQGSEALPVAGQTADSIFPWVLEAA